jgi:hypothetical protein
VAEERSRASEGKVSEALKDGDPDESRKGGSTDFNGSDTLNKRAAE